jgi:hypothetical protein
MSNMKLPKRIAVILPQNRTRIWHQKIISALERSYHIDVYTDALAPRYPVFLRVWMFIESCILEEFPLTKHAAIAAAAWRPQKRPTYSFIINLSEVPVADAGCPILETRFGDQVDSLGLVAALLARRNPFLSIRLAGQQEPIVASYLAVRDRIVLSRGLQFSFARLLALTERAALHLTEGSRAAMLPEIKSGFPSYSSLQLSLFIARFSMDKIVGRLLRKCQYQEHWSTAMIRTNKWDIAHDIQLQNLEVLPDDGRRYYADPFVFTENGQKWLFVEELNYQTGKGIISCAKLTEWGACEPFRPVLERSYHLSYPFVFRHEGQIYMVPETASNRTVELYRALSFPLEWELYRVLLEDILLYDPTLLNYKDRWWLFAAFAHEAASGQDELAIFHSNSLEGPWQPHPQNPVKSDCRSARPAGQIIADGGFLLRPAQDCEQSYGDAVVWLKINELTVERFSECEIAYWSGRIALHADGIHTFNRDGNLGVIDMRQVVWKYPRVKWTK